MIIRKKEHWFRMLFAWRGSVLPGLLPRLTALFIFSVVIVCLHASPISLKVPLNPAPLTLFGIALALFLGFRNNASYERFWEARKLWGALLNDTRSLARQALTMTAGTNTKVFINLLIACTYTLKHQLRHTSATHDMQRLLPKDFADKITAATYKPVMLLKAMGEWVQQSGTDTIIQSSFSTNLDKLSDIIGGCERIASTPIPFSYSILLHRTVYLYCFLLPFALVDSLQWMTPFIVVFIAYTFVAFEAIADEIEEPFGTEANDLALNAMCQMIETTLLEMAGEPQPGYPVSKEDIID